MVSFAVLEKLDRFAVELSKVTSDDCFALHAIGWPSLTINSFWLGTIPLASSQSHSNCLQLYLLKPTSRIFLGFLAFFLSFFDLRTLSVSSSGTLKVYQQRLLHWMATCYTGRKAVCCCSKAFEGFA